MRYLLAIMMIIVSGCDEQCYDRNGPSQSIECTTEAVQSMTPDDVNFPDIAGGYLPQIITAGQFADRVIGCTAQGSSTGIWAIIFPPGSNMVLGSYLFIPGVLSGISPPVSVEYSPTSATSGSIIIRDPAGAATAVDVSFKFQRIPLDR